jgi:uridine phosphorylase
MIKESDMPINKRGALYHLDVKPDELADTIITVGDPARVKQVSQHFDSIEYQCSHREFVTHTGYIGNKRLSVVSTGIGIPNIDIVMNELDALVNIDLNSRTTKDKLSSLNIIRIGTTGSICSDIIPGDTIVSEYALGFDNFLDSYIWTNNDESLHQATSEHFSNGLMPDFNTKADIDLLSQFEGIGLKGITATMPGFYGPQHRSLRLPLRYPNWFEDLQKFEWQGRRILNFEMETAALYAMSTLLGHRCLSLNLVLANRVGATFKTDAGLLMDKLIEKTLSIIL